MQSLVIVMKLIDECLSLQFGSFLCCREGHPEDDIWPFHVAVSHNCFMGFGAMGREHVESNWEIWIVCVLCDKSCVRYSHLKRQLLFIG
jgi:hypothetical protein